LLQERQPFNIAVIELEENPEIKFFSHLPGTPPDEVPVGAQVLLEFEETYNGQLVPEWRVARYSPVANIGDRWGLEE
jgi:uncharacterized OB-fold protein